MFSDSTLFGNVASSEAGGISCSELSMTRFIRCNITNNVAPKGGGLWSQSSSQCSVADSFLGYNQATSLSGGAISATESATVTVSGTTVVGNTAAEHGGAAYCDGSAKLMFQGLGLVVDNQGARSMRLLSLCVCSQFCRRQP